MVNPIRRALIATGAAVAAATAARRTFAQGDDSMSVYERGDVSIHYQDTGSGFPLLLIPGGGLNSVASYFDSRAPFNPIQEFSNDYRCITMDLRNANDGQSTGPLEIDRPWDSHTDDQLGLMDHLGITEFMVIGFCIGGPFIWNLLRRAGERIPAAVLAQPSGFDPELPNLFYEGNMANWGPALASRRPDITMEMVEPYLNNMYRIKGDFVFTVTREFVQNCQTPVLVLPDDIPAHPYDVAMESALLAPNSEVSLYPWKRPANRIPIAVRHIHSFLKANQPRTT